MAKFDGKQRIVHMRDELGSYQDFDGTKLDELIVMLTELQKKHGKDACFGVEVDSDYGPCSGYTSISFNVSSTRGETPLEYAERYKQWQAIEKAKRDQVNERRKLREEQDRKEFARLKKKFAK